MALGEPELEAQVMTVHIAHICQRLAEHRRTRLVGGWRIDAQHPDKRHLGCVSGEGRSRSAECESNENGEANHSMTSSARARIDGGTVRPSNCAVLRLTTSSNRVGCSTGRSAGFVPFKILST